MAERELSSHSAIAETGKKYVKPQAAITVFELLMIGGLSPETC